MSHCLMYKNGNSSVVRGVECDFVRIKYSEINQYKKNGWVSSLSEIDADQDFLSVFLSDPKSLTKDEMVEFAKSELNLKLSKRMLEDTMIEKISEALND